MSTRRPDKRKQAMRLVAKVLKMNPDPYLADMAQHLHDRLKLPMSTVLEAVPGETVVEKAATCGVSRQSYYAWLRGASRPNPTQAKLLAKLTGFDEEDIIGRRSFEPPPPRTRASRSARSV